MNMHTIADSILSKHQFGVAITAATTNGAGVDARGYEKGQAVFYAAPSGAGTTADCKLQESNDNFSTDTTDVTGAAFTQVTTAGGAKLYVLNINLAKRKRYLRLSFTGAGGSAAGQAYGIIQLGNARNLPVSQDNAAISV